MHAEPNETNREAAAAAAPRLAADDLEQVLEVTRSLAAPFELQPMLAAVAAAACRVLRAERCSVWLHDPASDELVLEVATDIRNLRLPMGTGLVGTCARDRRAINVPDCYADPRFDPKVDHLSGFHTRCSLTLPLIDHEQALVGVMQVLNRIGGVFDDADERLASALAAQCAIALQRVRMTAALIEGERMRHELDLARALQASLLPATMPRLPGYDCFGLARPSAQVGGDIFDLALLGQGLLVVLADATGHGLAPALSVTRMHAMLRMALRLGADLETTFGQVNDLLGETLADDRFVTAFIGLLDPATHRLRYLSGGQGPILHFHGRSGRCTRLGPTSFPLGAMPLRRGRPAETLAFEPGDRLLLVSDGLYEACDPDGAAFGVERVEQLIAARREVPMASLASSLLEAVAVFVRGAPQDDDLTIVLVGRGATE
jgi:phosphoserine phosphatase